MKIRARGGCLPENKPLSFGEEDARASVCSAAKRTMMPPRCPAPFSSRPRPVFQNKSTTFLPRLELVSKLFLSLLGGGGGILSYPFM